MGQKTAVFMTLGGQEAINKAYDQETRNTLGERLSFLEGIYDRDQLKTRRADLQKVVYIFSTWGMFPLKEDQIRDSFPKLKAVFYAAGSVQGFAKPYLACGVHVFSAFAANAVPVAEYVTAQILLAGKGFYLAQRLYRTKGYPAAREYMRKMPGNYGGKVGIIGVGTIGKLVISHLKNYKYHILVFDPFLPQEEADRLGVEKCDLNTIFEECLVISNHLANNEQTRGMMTYEQFSRMRPNAVFLNTGRGAQLVEDDLARALSEVPTRTAVLDVTFPEPVKPGHPFLTLENVFLTPHIAGSIGEEVARMGQYMAEEYEAFASGTPCRYEITEEMLKTMA